LDTFSNISAVLVTGGTGKFGKVIIKSLIEKGVDVAFTSRSETKIKALLDNLGDIKPRLIGLQIDLEQPDLINSLAERLKKESFYPEALINNARNLEYLKSEDGTMSAGNWHGEYTLGIVVPYQLTQFLNRFSCKGFKKVINIASMYGVVAPNMNLYDDPSHSPINYGTVKAAMIHLTKEMAVRHAKDGIAVNAVSYGGVEGRVNEEFKKRYANLCPINRMLKESEIAGPIKFLLSENSSGMTGHNLVVDGGWSIW
jgi:NAD(P)-dependent dehydrogenase (short-subunit alcohol dehydrogenase family)